MADDEDKAAVRQLVASQRLSGEKASTFEGAS